MTAAKHTHSFYSLEYCGKLRDDTTPNRTVHGVNNFSVSTQTTLSMKPVLHAVDSINESNNDYQLELLLDEHDEPPPSYNDAVANLMLSST